MIASNNPRRAGLRIGLLLSCALAAVTVAAPRNSGVTPAPPIEDDEINDTWSSRAILTGNDSCKFDRVYRGHLGDFNPDQPDTAICVTTFELGCDARNDDGGPFARYGGSGAYFITPSLGQPGNWFPIPRIAVSGKGSYATNPLTVTHNQFGEFQVYIEFYDSAGFFISRQVRTGTLTGGNSEVVFTSIPVPPNTLDFDVITNPLAEEHGDVDFFEIQNLRPNSQYTVTVRGLNIRAERDLDTILGRWSTSIAILLDSNDDICNSASCGAYDPGSRLTVTSDSSGRAIVSVTGYDDFNFNGTSDSSGYRHRETGGYYLRVSYNCGLGCADIDGDCEVNFNDLNILLERWGDSCD